MFRRCRLWRRRLRHVCVDVVLKSQTRRVAFSRILPETWSSLVEGDEQLDRPNSQKFTKLCHACVT